MLFTEATFDKCLSNLEKINAILFFQTNFGLAIEMSEKITKLYHHNDNVVIDFQDNEKNFIQLLREQLCDDFFSSKKIIKVYNFKPNGKSRIKNELNFLNEKKYRDKIILFFAPDLDSKSAIKTIFEKGDFTASIGCYEDDKKTASKYIKNFFEERKIKITEQVVQAMAEMLHGDRKLLLSECEKMALYADNNEITINDINNAIINEQSANPVSFIDFLLTNNIKQAIEEFKLLEKEDIQMINISRLFLNVVEEILDIKSAVQNNTDLDSVIKSKFLFWKRIPLVKMAVTNSTFEMLEFYIKIAISTEKMAKVYSNDIAKQYFVRNTILREVH